MDDTHKSSCSCPPRVGPISWILQLNVFFCYFLLMREFKILNTEIPNTRHDIKRLQCFSILCRRLALEALHHQLRELPARSFLVLKWVWFELVNLAKNNCDSWTLQNRFLIILKILLLAGLVEIQDAIHDMNTPWEMRTSCATANVARIQRQKKSLLCCHIQLKRCICFYAINAACRHAGNSKIMVINR